MLRSLSCLQLQSVLGVSHRFLTLVLDSRYHRLNSIPPEMSMASPPRNSALAVGPDCSWISWSHRKAQVTDCRPQRLPYSFGIALTPLVLLQERKGIEGFSGKMDKTSWCTSLPQKWDEATARRLASFPSPLRASWHNFCMECHCREYHVSRATTQAPRRLWWQSSSIRLNSLLEAQHRCSAVWLQHPWAALYWQ